MSSDLIATALDGATDTRQIVIGADVLNQTAAVFTDLFGRHSRAIVVADGNTYPAAGMRAEESLRAAGVATEDAYIFEGKPTLYADYAAVSRLRDHLAGLDAVAVCVGSGTLNDITKLASGELGREYMVVATAASQDGYAAFGASVTRDGFKITRTCPAPAGVVVDVRTLASAPALMTATGYGDLIEKLTGGADWIVAEALGVEPIDPRIWRLVQGPLREALADPDGLARGDLDAVGRLSEGLVMSGLAMQAHQSSRPASGSGHHFSHLWEMEGLGMDAEPPLSHGLKVGLGTVAISALYEVAFTRDLTDLDIDAAVAAWPSRSELEERVRSAMDTPVAQPAVDQTMAKYVPAPQLRERLESARRAWPDLLPRLRNQLVPAAQVQQWLTQVGAVSHPSQIGLDMQRFRDTYVRSNMIRSRYTMVDLLAEANLLGECVAELFEPSGFWGSQSW